MARVVASIEARMSSSRLPGKVLTDVAGKPALTRLVERLKHAKLLDDIVLATSLDRSDDALEAWAAEQGVRCYRGSLNDVLDRVVRAHQMMQSEVIVEITGDCPLIDPAVIDLGIDTFFSNDCDVVSNTARLSFPMGADVQVFRAADLTWVSENIRDPAVREHVSLYFYEHPDRYRIFHLRAPPQWQAPDYRLQLDYPEDKQFIEEIYRRLEPNYGGAFGVPEIMELLRKSPELLDINRHCIEKETR